jgi:hypothetical protein
MKDYTKVGNRKNKPAYRTPSRFIANKSIKNKKVAWRPASKARLARWRPWDQAARLEHRRIKERRKRAPA